ncbi:response regulator transcription factor [Streptomyces fuscigenes]|uniref:response regulator transcription factor n=1 Tax=Streptomyces fuscigenes TaxID=1528880 RepID=UPI001F45102F|nr:response regulator transcription factor [Streptomyces fuscigenes]MCF3960866.1 response regulator transcription factor [Streptomyces fuscigenes]
MTLTVLVADDQAMVRTGFRMILSREHDLEVVGEAGNGVETVRLVRELRPDVALVDIRMPVMDGLRATRLLAAEGCPTRVVVITTYDDDETVAAAVEAGAHGIVLKDAQPQFLLDAVRAAAGDGALLSPSVALRLLRGAGSASGRSRASRTGRHGLSERELAVVRAVARGLTNAEIGSDLGLSLPSVKALLTSARSRIGARNRTELAVWAWESGLVR